MDLIGELIQNKKVDEPIPIKEILTELIQYEKLSRKDQFKHLPDNPMLQKKLPYCWQAFEGSTRMHWLLNELSTIMQTLSERDLEIFNDLSKHYTKKEQKQINIIGNSVQYQFRYHTLVHLPQTFNYSSALYLTNERDDNEVHTAIIHMNNKHIDIYIGVIEANKDDEDIETVGKLEPFTYTKNEQAVTIPTYSVQGNNDYPFAYTAYHHISMPDTATVCYINKRRPSEKTYVDLTRSDIQKLSFSGDKLDVLADILLTYEPAPDEKMVLHEKLQEKRVINREDQ